jgi:replicative DNA helicase
VANPFLNLKDNQIEIIVLAYLIKHPEFLDKYFDKINDKIFYNPENKKILSVLNDFSKNSKNITAETLKNYLPDVTKETIRDLVKEVDSIVYSQDTFLNYLIDLEDLYLRREIYKTTQDKNKEISNFSTDKSVKDIIVELEKDIFEITNFKKETFEIKDFKSVGTSSLKLIEKAFQKKGKISGTSTGFIDLDNILGGMQNSDLIILAGRPSMGKTALATNIAFNAAKLYKKDGLSNSGLFFSLEMSAEQIGLRILAEESKVESSKLRKGDLTAEDTSRLQKSFDEISNLGFYFDDSPNLTVGELRSKLRRYKKNYNISFVVIDYLQLIKPEKTRDNRVNELSEITRSLKQLAKEFNIPVLALSQLSRQVESRDDKRPLLSDLRESGSIEQDADIVMFVYREYYYLQNSEPKRKDGENNQTFQDRVAEWQEKCNNIMNHAELLISKQRNGPTGKVDLHFDDKLTKFSSRAKDRDTIS